MKFRLIVPAALLLVFLIAACQPVPELRNEAYLQDTSLVDGEPCEAPCWRGIIPGETAWQEALTIIEDDATLTDLNVEESPETDEIAATFQQVDGIPCCVLYSTNGEFVDRMLLQVAPQVTLGEVVEVHGEPTYLTTEEVSPEQAGVGLFYPDIQTVVYAFVAGAETGTISQTSEIFAVLYMAQDDYDEVLTSVPLYQWEGYEAFSAYASTEVDITPVPTVEGGVATDEAVEPTSEEAPAEDNAAATEEAAAEEPTSEEAAAGDDAAPAEETEDAAETNTDENASDGE